MAIITTFKRYELKYMLTREQKDRLLPAIKKYMAPDPYGHTVIRNLYYDTDTYRLIRRSLEKPVYKEKLRIRSYTSLKQDDQCFVELKKKYNHVVYKRRITMPYSDAILWLAGDRSKKPQGQISEEIQYFIDHYSPIRPTVYLSYGREAWYSPDSTDLRITFDDEIAFRREDLSLCAQPSGIRLLPEQNVLMEIKTSRSIPLWLTALMTENKIYRTSFSKYGTAYEKSIYSSIKGEFKNA